MLALTKPDNYLAINRSVESAVLREKKQTKKHRTEPGTGPSGLDTNSPDLSSVHVMMRTVEKRQKH